MSTESLILPSERGGVSHAPMNTLRFIPGRPMGGDVNVRDGFSEIVLETIFYYAAVGTPGTNVVRSNVNYLNDNYNIFIPTVRNIICLMANMKTIAF